MQARRSPPSIAFLLQPLQFVVRPFLVFWDLFGESMAAKPLLIAVGQLSENHRLESHFSMPPKTAFRVSSPAISVTLLRIVFGLTLYSSASFFSVFDLW